MCKSPLRKKKKEHGKRKKGKENKKEKGKCKNGKRKTQNYKKGKELELI